MKPRLRIDASTLGDIPFFSRAQAREWGISDHDLRLLLARGQIVRLDRGWFTTRVGSTAEELHQLRTIATLSRHPGAVAAARHSAVLLHGLPLARADLSLVEIARRAGAHGRCRTGVRETQMPDVPVTKIELDDPQVCVLATDPAHSIVATAMTNNPMSAVVAGDAALRARMVSEADLRCALDTYRGCPGIEDARAAVGVMDRRHESPGETLLAGILRELGWSVTPQVWVRTASGRRYRVDFVLDQHRVVIEFDGQVKYTTPGARAAQERREMNILAMGWVVIRFDWGELEPSAVDAKVRQGIRLATEAA